MSAVYHLNLLDKERRTRLYTNRLISTSRSCSTTSSGVTTIRITALTYATGTSGGGIISVDRATAVDHAATDSAACRPTVRVATGAEAVAGAASSVARVGLASSSSGLCTSLSGLAYASRHRRTYAVRRSLQNPDCLYG